MKVLTAAWFALALLAPPWTTAAEGGDAGYYYYDDHKVKIPLTAVSLSVAVFDDSGAGSDELADLLDAAGYPDAQIDPLTHGLWIAVLRDASDPPAIEGAASVITRLLDLDQGSRFFSPLFEGEGLNGYFVLPDIIVKFWSGVSEARIDQILAEAGIPEAQKVPFLWEGRRYFITPNRRSGIDVLDISNALALFPEVVYSDPFWLTFGGLTSVDRPEVIPALGPTSLVILVLAVALAAVAYLRLVFREVSCPAVRPSRPARRRGREWKQREKPCRPRGRAGPGPTAPTTTT